MAALTEDQLKSTSDYCHLNYVSSLSTGLVHFNPKDIALHGLTSMIKVVAQMKNLRRGHTSQGEIKKIEIDQTYEGYANFMAPGRMQMIASDVKLAETRLDNFLRSSREKAIGMNKEEKKAYDAEKLLLERQVEDSKNVFSKDILKPKADTYLTAEWDEMVPFPTSESSPLSVSPLSPPILTTTQPGKSASTATDPATTAATPSPSSALILNPIASRLGTNRRALAIMEARLAMYRKRHPRI